MILVGCIVSTSSIIVLAQQDDGSDDSVPRCMAIPWLYSVGFCITFGAMFVRIKRIYGLLQCALETRRVLVTAKDTFATIALILGIDVTVLIVWSSVDPLIWTRRIASADQYGNPLESEGFCHSDHWQIFTSIIASFHLLLMGVACYMCYVARGIPENLSNGKYVAIAMFSNLQILIIALPVLIVVGSDPQASFVVRVLAIWINDFVVVFVIFGSLIYNVYLQDAKTRTSGRGSVLALGDDIMRYATKFSTRGDSGSNVAPSGWNVHSEESGHHSESKGDDAYPKVCPEQHQTATYEAYQNDKGTTDKEEEEKEEEQAAFCGNMAAASSAVMNQEESLASDTKPVTSQNAPNARQLSSSSFVVNEQEGSVMPH